MLSNLLSARSLLSHAPEGASKMLCATGAHGNINIVHNMNMSGRLVFRLLKISYREFYDKTAFNFISYTIQNSYTGKMC